MQRLVINHFPNNLYIKQKYSSSCLRIWKKCHGLPNGYELITQNTFQNNATKATPNPTKNPNPSPNPNPPKLLTLPKTLTLSQTLILEAYCGEIP